MTSVQTVSNPAHRVLGESILHVARFLLLIAFLVGVATSLSSQSQDPDWQEGGQWRWYTRHAGEERMFEAETYVIGSDAVMLAVYVATPNEVEEFSVYIEWLGGVDFVDQFSRILDEHEEEQELRYRIGDDRVRIAMVGTNTLVDASYVIDQEVARTMIQRMVRSERMYVGLEQETGELAATFELAGLADALRASGLLYRLEDQSQ